MYAFFSSLQYSFISYGNVLTLNHFSLKCFQNAENHNNNYIIIVTIIYYYNVINHNSKRNRTKQ